jgi:5-hydroxyisourate hydrolase-like protein (transthyretin family)
MEGKHRSAKIHTTLWHKLTRKKHNNDGETPNPNSSQKKGNQGPRNYDLTMIYQHHFSGNGTRNWVKGYFLVSWCNRSSNQKKTTHKHVEKLQPKSLVLLRLSSKNYTDLTRQTANLSRQQQANKTGNKQLQTLTTYRGREAALILNSACKKL